MTTAIVILFIISALMGTALATLFYEVDFRANQLQNINSKQIKTRDQILQMVSNLDSQVKSLTGKVNEIETNLYMINEATDTSDELAKAADVFLEKLAAAFPEQADKFIEKIESKSSIDKLKEYSKKRTDEEVANYEKQQEYNKMNQVIKEIKPVGEVEVKEAITSQSIEEIAEEEALTDEDLAQIGIDSTVQTTEDDTK